MPVPTLSIVIVTWNNEREIGACLDSIGSPPADWEVWVVDNASRDQTVGIVMGRFPWARLISSETNQGFAHAANRALSASSSDFVLLLNPDTECSPDAVRAALCSMAEHPSAGVLGVRLQDAKGATQPSCFRFPTPALNFLQFSGAYRLLPAGWRAQALLGTNWDHSGTRAVDWLLGAFLLVRRSAVDAVGPLCEDYFLFAEDIDWCYRFKERGYEVRYAPNVAVLHHGGRSTAKLSARRRDELGLRNKYRFCAKHYGALSTRLIQFTDVCGFGARVALGGGDDYFRNGLRESWRGLKSPLESSTREPR